jgi:hypothetical protein
MIGRWSTIGLIGAAAILFGWGVDLARLFDGFQSIVVGLSILVAAVFVHLNRGMPTLDWKSLNVDERQKLTGSIVQLTAEYGHIIAINALTLFLLIGLTMVGKADACAWPPMAKTLVSASIGGLLALCVMRMAYVVWRDFDVVRLQKRLIDGAGMREHDDAQAKEAEGKIASIREAGLKKHSFGSPKPWQ